MYSVKKYGSKSPEKRMGLQMLSSGVLAVGLCAGGAFGGEPLSLFGYDFALVGDPGNRNTIDEELDKWTMGAVVGAVDYEFRMATLEVTVGQYFEFAELYHPYYTINTGNVFGFSDFTGGDIDLAWGEIMLRPGVSPNKPINLGWEYATRYVNWLHNGKVNEEWAFESGVYDTSTYTENDDGTWNHQIDHDPGARFWLPTRDEWTKAGYWDPELNDGEGGYHRFPNGSSIESLPTIERNSGQPPEYPIDVSQYPDIQSPWGIMDMAGGVSEWTGSMIGTNQHRRYLMGSAYWNNSYDYLFQEDRIGGRRGGTVYNGNGGIRLVATAYAPTDLNQDGRVNYFDISLFIRWFINGDERADFRLDGVFDLDDVRVFLGLVEV